jgi:hypothetical protein
MGKSVKMLFKPPGKTPPFGDQEQMLVWAQMKLERVDLTAEVLVELLKDAYKTGYDIGNKDGYSDGRRGDGSMVFSGDRY